jgi:hypothetical protein
MTCSGRTIGPGKYVSYIDFIETEIWDDSKLSHQYVDFESLMV